MCLAESAALTQVRTVARVKRLRPQIDGPSIYSTFLDTSSENQYAKSAQLFQTQPYQQVC